MHDAVTVADIPTPAQSLAEARAFFRNGEFFRAYDIAVAGLRLAPSEMPLAHLAVLSLANAGATQMAVAKFAAFGLHEHDSPSIRALLGRLKKDQAFAAPRAERQPFLREARAIYEAAYQAATANGDKEAYYPAINAATMALLSGDAHAAARLASDVLAMLEPIRKAGEADYWVIATALEANLLKGDIDAALALAGPAVAACGANYADLATTGRQLERILDNTGKDATLFSGFRPPAIVHYCGHIIAAPGKSGRFPAQEEASVSARIAAVIDGMRIGAAYGSLAAGADLLFVEALQARGIAVNIILPFAKSDMLEQSVRHAGPGWEARFETCLAAAKTVRYATEDLYLGDDHLFTYCSRLAMGLAVLCARHLHAPVHQMVVWDGEARSGVAGTVADMKTWSKAGHPCTIIRCGARTTEDALENYQRPRIAGGFRDTRAMLFGDIKGFSKLTDSQLPPFATHVMGAAARVLREFSADTDFVNTWGDGIFAVFADAGQAANCALALQEAMRAIDLHAVGLPDKIQLRLGGHLGPVYEMHDPILDRLNYFGVHVSRAARIEPVTPEGLVYVTETFAAVLALHNAQEFACDYVGFTEMAKEYGQLRMFSLRRQTGSASPAAITDIERVALV
jgi:class 3 adenylate cyclase